MDKKKRVRELGEKLSKEEIKEIKETFSDLMDTQKIKDEVILKTYEKMDAKFKKHISFREYWEYYSELLEEA